jgi:hypothetical protein
MRVTDDRYTRDRLRLDLALRLIRHEARTQTIRGWTGLSDDRIRKLYRSYVAEAGGARIRRHRGKSPRQSAYFLRNAELRRQASTLATLLCLLGLIERGARPHLATVSDLRWGETFCRVYETYTRLFPEPALSFEHACHLQRTLSQQRELGLDECDCCGALIVVSAFAPRVSCCDFCAADRQRTGAGREPDG